MSNSKFSTTAKLFNGMIITIGTPNLETARKLLENKNGSDLGLPGPQLLFYLTMLNELEQQVPNFKKDNNEIVNVFAISWRESSLEYTDEFVILANKLGF